MRNMAVIAVLGLLSIALPAEADVWTGCVPLVREATGDAVLIGDGPLVGDAPDGTAVPAALGCYTGELDDEDDADEYWLLPGWHNVFGMVMRFWGLDGCYTATLTLEDTGATAALSLCKGDVKGIAVLGLHDVHVTFSGGPGTYQFAFE